MIRFPTTPEAFIAYQEARIHRELDNFERELSSVVVDLANGSYQEGLNGMRITTMSFVKEVYRARGHSIDPVARIWESICWWCDRAYMAGKEAAQHD